MIAFHSQCNCIWYYEMADAIIMNYNSCKMLFHDLIPSFRVKFTSKFINTQPGQFSSSDPSSQSGAPPSQTYDSRIHCPFSHFASPSSHSSGSESGASS